MSLTFFSYMFFKVLINIFISIIWFGIITQSNNAIYIFLYFEILVLTACVLFATTYSIYLSLIGLFFFIFGISIAAIKAAIGLSIIITWIKHWNTLNIFH